MDKPPPFGMNATDLMCLLRDLNEADLAKKLENDVAQAQRVDEIRRKGSTVVQPEKKRWWQRKAPAARTEAPGRLYRFSRRLRLNLVRTYRFLERCVFHLIVFTFDILVVLAAPVLWIVARGGYVAARTMTNPILIWQKWLVWTEPLLLGVLYWAVLGAVCIHRWTYRYFVRRRIRRRRGLEA